MMIDMLSLESRREIAEVKFAYDLLQNNIKWPHLCDRMKRHQPVRNLRNTTPVEHHSSDIAYLEPFNRCSISFNKFEKLYLEDNSRLSLKDRIAMDIRNKDKPL